MDGWYDRRTRPRDERDFWGLLPLAIPLLGLYLPTLYWLLPSWPGPESLSVPDEWGRGLTLVALLAMSLAVSLWCCRSPGDGTREPARAGPTGRAGLGGEKSGSVPGSEKRQSSADEPREDREKGGDPATGGGPAGKSEREVVLHVTGMMQGRGGVT